jgi:AcrR family transcriptional regulator
MSTEASAPARRRRRGEQLALALLTAAWEELVEVGYVRLTMASVAARAQTSEPVLYRRWPNKEQLVLAALEHYRQDHAVELPDTGSLRGDLIAALTGMGRTSAAFFMTAGAAAVSGLLGDSGLTPAQVRDRVIGDRRLARVRSIYERAQERGELDLDRMPAAALAMPFDLVRQDLLMGAAPVSEARIRSIVDELFLPLVRISSGA